MKTQISGKWLSDFYQRIETTIAEHAMLSEKDRVLVAVSGGPDSVALLLVMLELARRQDLDLAVGHLNHGLRGKAADREAEFVKQLADRHKLPSHISKVNLDGRTGSLEERARDQRYAFFEQVAVQWGYNKIALGHQANDNAEAVLMNLLRGSGPLGLSGIPPVREEKYIRPLIGTKRDDILAYLKHRKIDYMHDASNTDKRFLRNRIRHLLIPHLEENFSPEVVDRLNRTAALCTQEEAWYKDYLAPILKTAVVQMKPEVLVLSKQSLIQQPKALRRRLVRAALRRWQGHLRRLDFGHIESLLALLEPAGPVRRLDLPGGVTCISTRTGLQFRRSWAPVAVAPYEYEATPGSSEPVTVRIPTAGCRLSLQLFDSIGPFAYRETRRRCVWFDAEKLIFPLKIRNFKDGDRFQPFGMAGSQKLKKLFINEKIAPERRRTTPLLLSGDTILWVAGVRRSAFAPVRESTKTFLRIELLK